MQINWRKSYWKIYSKLGKRQTEQRFSDEINWKRWINFVFEICCADMTIR